MTKRNSEPSGAPPTLGPNSSKPLPPKDSGTINWRKCNAKQRAFLAFVLAHYVSEGVEELDQRKLTPLLRLKYHDSLSDALADLGKPEEIGRVFAGFQKYLYQGGA